MDAGRHDRIRLCLYRQARDARPAAIRSRGNLPRREKRCRHNSIGAARCAGPFAGADRPQRRLLPFADFHCRRRWRAKADNAGKGLGSRACRWPGRVPPRRSLGRSARGIGRFRTACGCAGPSRGHDPATGLEAGTTRSAQGRRRHRGDARSSAAVHARQRQRTRACVCSASGRKLAASGAAATRQDAARFRFG